MDAIGTQEQIRELETIRSQKRLWQLCLTLALAVILVVSLLKIRSAAYGLVTDGPTKTAFVSDLSTRLQQDVVPSVQQMSVQALHEINFADEVKKLNRRTPELAQASMKQMKILGSDLADRGKKILNTTVTDALKQRESKIRTMFPEATDAQVTGLMTNLTAEAQEQVADLNDSLFAPHKKALDGIVQDITLIQDQDANTVKGEQPTWEMGLLVFDLAREDLKGLETTDTANQTNGLPKRSGTEKKK